MSVFCVLAHDVDPGVPHTTLRAPLATDRVVERLERDGKLVVWAASLIDTRNDAATLEGAE